MFKKILFLAVCGIVLTTLTAQSITLKEFFEKPLPSAVEFVEGAVEWLKWLWSKIVYYTEIIFGWTLDNILLNLWKFFIWLWSLIKNALLAGWGTIDQIAQMLASGSGIDWKNIVWPWNN